MIIFLCEYQDHNLWFIPDQGYVWLKNTLSNEQINDEEIIHNSDFYATINAALKERDHHAITEHNTNNHH